MAPSKQNDREARQARERLRAYQARQTVHEHQVKRRTRDNVIAGDRRASSIVALAVGAQLLYFSGGPGARASAAAVALRRDARAPRVRRHRRRAAEDHRRGPHLDGHDDDQRRPARHLPRRRRRPAGRLRPSSPSSQKSFYDGLTCHRLTNERLLRAAVRRPERRRHRRPRLQLRPDRERPGRQRLPGGHHRDGAPERQRATARAASSSSSTRTRPSRPTPPAATP